jgi:putative ABC transport system substrate-binding protein
VIEITFEKRDPDSAARQVRAAHPGMIVALGARAARLAHERFPRVPLVYGMVGDPARLALAGANATGVSAEVSTDVELAALRAIVPGVSRVAFLHGSGACASRLREAREAAERAGITLVDVPVLTLAELPERLHGAMNEAPALWLAPDTLLTAPETFRFIVEQSIQHHTPLFVFAPPLVRAGALAAAAPDVDWVGGELAERVRRIRAGARAGDLSVSAARSSSIVFNPATARAIGVVMPAGARPWADAGPP